MVQKNKQLKSEKVFYLRAPEFAKMPSSLCPHMFKEYTQKVTDILQTYKSQIVAVVKFRDIGDGLVSSLVIKKSERDKLLKLPSNQEQMETLLEFISKRMWGLENFITVLIDRNIDTWLSEELFQAYVRHLVVHMKKLKNKNSCVCFQAGTDSRLYRVWLQSLETFDKYLNEIGSSMGFLTLTMHPVKNALAFISNKLPLPKKTIMTMEECDEEILESDSSDEETSGNGNGKDTDLNDRNINDIAYKAEVEPELDVKEQESPNMPTQLQLDIPGRTALHSSAADLIANPKLREKIQRSLCEKSPGSHESGDHHENETLFSPGVTGALERCRSLSASEPDPDFNPQNVELNSLECSEGVTHSLDDLSCSPTSLFHSCSSLTNYEIMRTLDNLRNNEEVSGDFVSLMQKLKVSTASTQTTPPSPETCCRYLPNEERPSITEIVLGSPRSPSSANSVETESSSSSAYETKYTSPCSRTASHSKPKIQRPKPEIESQRSTSKRQSKPVIPLSDPLPQKKGISPKHHTSPQNTLKVATVTPRQRVLQAIHAKKACNALVPLPIPIKTEERLKPQDYNIQQWTNKQIGKMNNTKTTAGNSTTMSNLFS